MRSKMGEFSFMTLHYARCDLSAASFVASSVFLFVFAVDPKAAVCLKRRHAGSGSDHAKIDQGLRPREPAGGGRIAPARRTCRPSPGGRNPLQSIYCGGSL